MIDILAYVHCEALNLLNKTFAFEEQPNVEEGMDFNTKIMPALFRFLSLFFSKDSRPPPPPAPTGAPSHITGGLGSLIKIKQITCKDQRKWSIPSLNTWQALGYPNFEQPSVAKAWTQASDSQNNIVLTLPQQPNYSFLQLFWNDYKYYDNRLVQIVLLE